MTVHEEMLAGVATYLAAIPGISRAHYPPPTSISQMPCAIVFGGPMQAEGGQEWKVTGRIRVYICMAPVDTQAAIGAADALIEPIMNQFSANSPAWHLNDQVPSGNIDFCRFAAAELSQILPYAGQQYLGAVVFLEFKYRRFASGGYAL